MSVTPRTLAICTELRRHGLRVPGSVRRPLLNLACDAFDKPTLATVTRKQLQRLEEEARALGLPVPPAEKPAEPPTQEAAP